jgi:hypothetical protein
MLEHNKLKIVSGQSKGTFDIFSENETAVLGNTEPMHSLLNSELHIFEAQSKAIIFQINWRLLPFTKVEVLDATKSGVGWFRGRNLYHPTGKIWAHIEINSKDHFQWISNGSNLIADMRFDSTSWALNFTNPPTNPFASMNILGNALWFLTTQA